MAMTLTSGHLEGRASNLHWTMKSLRSICETFTLQVQKFDEDDDTIGLLMLLRLVDDQFRELDKIVEELREMAADLKKKELAEAKKGVSHGA